MKAQKIVTIANVWGETQAEYVEAVERLSKSAVDVVELNLSCPNAVSYTHLTLPTSDLV